MLMAVDTTQQEENPNLLAGVVVGCGVLAREPATAIQNLIIYARTCGC
jgi:hypothetical protein